MNGSEDLRRPNLRSIRRKSRESISGLSEGSTIQASIVSVANFGVFVDLGALDGLVHRSTLQLGEDDRVDSKYSVGDMLDVRITAIDHEQMRVSLEIV